jgi:hypothetical protein
MLASFISDKDQIPAYLAIQMYKTPPDTIYQFTKIAASRVAAIYVNKEQTVAIVAIRGTVPTDQENLKDDSVSLLFFTGGVGRRVKFVDALLEGVEFLVNVSQKLGYIALGLVC